MGMDGFCTRLLATRLFATSALLALLGLGCAAEDVSCPEVAGVFEPLYLPVQSTCEPLANPYRVPFDGGNSGVNTSIQRYANAVVMTNIIMKGCTVGMTQTVADEEGSVQLQIDGSDLSVESEDRVTGMVELVRYDANHQVACSGMYDATFTKNEQTIGGAAN